MHTITERIFREPLIPQQEIPRLVYRGNDNVVFCIFHDRMLGQPKYSGIINSGSACPKQ